MRIAIHPILVFLMVFFHQAYAQNFHIHGMVHDEANSPLVGASVYLPHSDLGTITDSRGHFELEVLQKETLLIVISAVGYKVLADTLSLQSNANAELHYDMVPLQVMMDEVQITSRKHEEHIQSSNLVSKEQLLERDQGTLVKSLERIPGINAMNIGVGISKPIIRGMSANRVQVSADGVKQEGQQWGADHGLEIDQFGVEGIQVIKGPDVLSQGSDGMGGAIRILPSRLPASDTTYGNIRLLGKSNNELGAMAVSLGTSKDNNFLMFNATAMSYGDMRVPADSFTYNRFVLPIYDQQLKNTAGGENNASFEAGILREWGSTRLKVSTYNLQMGIFPGAMGIPRFYDLSPDGDSRNIDLPFQNVNHHKVVSTTKLSLGQWHDELDLIASYQDNRRKELSEPHSHGNFQASDSLAIDLQLQTYALTIRYKPTLRHKWKHHYGAEFRYLNNQQAGFEFFIPGFAQWNTSAYYIGKVPVSEAGSFEVGSRMEYTHFQVEDGFVDLGEEKVQTRVKAFSKDFINASVSLGYKQQLTEASELKLNLTRSFRTPNIAELAANGVHHGTFRHELGSPEMEQEHGYQADLTYVFSQNRWQLQASTFYYYINDFIYLKPTPEFSPLPEGGQLFIYQQDNAVFTGIEFQGSVQLVKGFSIQEAFDWVYNYNLETNLPLPSTPPAMNRLNLMWESKRELKNEWGSWFEVTTAADQNRVDRNEPSTPGYTIFGVGTQWKRSFNWGIVHVVVRGENITNKAYFNHLSRYRWINIPEQGRNWIVSLNYRF